MPTKTQAELNTDIDTQFATNTSGQITAPKLRTVLHDVVDNFQVTADRINATGTPSSSTFLAGDNVWRLPPSGGGGGSPSTVDSIASRAAIAATTFTGTIPTFLRTAGYAAEGDGGHGLYKTGANPSSSNKGYVQSGDGTWWYLVPEGGEVRVEQFGGKANYVSSVSRGTDNYQPIKDAMAYGAYSPGTFYLYGNKVRFGLGKYWISQRLEITEWMWLQGIARTMNNSSVSTQLIFPHTSGGFLFQSQSTTLGSRAVGSPALNGTNGSRDSTLEGLGIIFETPTTYNGEHGIQAFTSINIINVYLDQVPGDGIHLYGSSGYGDCNNWLIRDTEVHYCEGHGLYIDGNDANAGNCYNFHTNGNGCLKTSIADFSSLGNHYFGLELDGYGNKATTYSGKVYSQIGHTPTIGVAPYSTQGSMDNWLYIRDVVGGEPDGVNTFAWDSAHQYTIDDLRIPMIAFGQNYISGVYSEGGFGLFSHAPGSIVIGGQSSNWTPMTPKMDVGSALQLMCPTGVGSTVTFQPNDAGYASHGAYHRTWIGGTRSDSNGSSHSYHEGIIDLFGFERATDGVFSVRFDTNNNVTWSWVNQSPVMSFTGPNTTMAVPPNKLLMLDAALQDPGNSNQLLTFGTRGSTPTGPGLYLQGSRYFAPTGMYVVITGGGLENATWSSGTTYDANTVLKTSAPRWYKCQGGGVSTVQPTHTSGTVTTADGLIWKYLANTAAAFRFVATSTASAYTTTSLSTNRTLTNTSTAADVLNALGTLISDLRTAGIIPP